MDEQTTRHWTTEFTALARNYWSPERTAELVGGKDLLILPRDAPLLLRALGLLHRDASMPPTQHRKFLQINHMVRLLASALADLHRRFGAIRLLDAGCGRSYLSLLLAWCARERWHYPLEVLGIDRDAQLIAECRRRTELAGLADVVRFAAGTLASIDRGDPALAFGGRPIHAVFALHACDTATCDAIALGIELGADLIAVAPCCHAELSRNWSELADQQVPSAFAPAWRPPHLRREIAAHLTDAMRMLLLREAGYRVTAMEFVGAEHTAKNTLLRAVRDEPDPAARLEYDALVAATGGRGIGLADRLRARVGVTG